MLTAIITFVSNIFRSIFNYIKYVFPGLFANLEDVLFASYNKVSLYSQPNKIAVMTGGNRGIGMEALKKLLACEMTVVLGVRNPEASRKSIEKFLGDAFNGDKVFFEKCDTGDFESVRSFAAKVQERFKAINILINNSGIMCVPFAKTKDGYESQMAVNFLGHALLTHLLFPQLIAGSNKANCNSRIVNVSSCAHKCGEIDYDDINMERNYHAGLQYGNSKLAQIMFSNHVDRICKERGLKVQSCSIHPGVVNTELFDTDPIMGKLVFVRQILFKTPESGSRTQIYAAIAPEQEGKGGNYLSNCRPASTKKIAKNPAECSKFFKFTCDLLKINEFGVAK